MKELGAAQTPETALKVKNMYLIVMIVGVVITVVVTQLMYNIPAKEDHSVDEQAEMEGGNHGAIYEDSDN